MVNILISVLLIISCRFILSEIGICESVLVINVNLNEDLDSIR